MMAADLGSAVMNASRLGAHADLILRALENRGALAALEFEEAGQRLQRALVGGVFAAVALLLTGVTVTAVVAAIFWETPQRVLALLILGLVEAATVVGSGWYVWSRWNNWKILAHTREQLAKDSACLREILTPPRS